MVLFLFRFTDQHVGSIKRAVPKMWSFDRDDRANRALIRVGDSKWSGPQSFEAIGSDYEVAIPSSNSQNEIHVGVSLDESQGKVSWRGFCVFCQNANNAFL
jgi:hypothetical protein